IFTVKIANTNDSFTNINVNGLGLKPVYAQGGHPKWPLLPGDLQVGDVILFVYDGSTFWITPDLMITENITFNILNVDDFNTLFQALGRKRISTSGSVRILLGPGNWGYYVTAPDASIPYFQTYHIDAERITVEGSMKPGQTPPYWADFTRTD